MVTALGEKQLNYDRKIENFGFSRISSKDKKFYKSRNGSDIGSKCGTFRPFNLRTQ